MKEFIFLPEKLHTGHAGWVPPIYSDDRKTFDSRRNLAHRYCDSMLALAYSNGEAVGRIAGVINRRYNTHWRRSDARFGYLECIEDETVAAALLRSVEEWARGRGMQRIVGPQGFTEEDPEGFLLDGFEYPPNLATYYNYPFLPPMVERQGYTKEVDYVVYKVILEHALTEAYKSLYERACRHKEFTLIEFSRQREIRPYIRPMFRLMNECFEAIYGYSELDESEMDQLAGRYLPVVDPRFIKLVADQQGEIIGFMIGIPSLAEGIRKARGRLFPFGAFKILRSRRLTEKIDAYLGGVKEGYRGKGVDVLLGYRFMKSALDAGFEYMDSHHELETNTLMRAEMERVGGTVYKRFRIFQKSLQ